ncbi:MAG: alpha-2-macroglobulin [Chthoniobacteraceae bacterium]
MRIFRGLMEFLFGHVSWVPPVWLAALGRWASSHRKMATMLALLVVLLSGGGWWGYRVYKNRPKPEMVKVSVGPLPVTRLQDGELKPPSLVVNFGASVAPLGQIRKSVMEGITLEPAAHGFWRWDSDRQLVFHTREDWPADKTYRITIDPKILALHILLDRYVLEAATPKFKATFSKLEFYQNPKDPTQKEVVATLEFTHAVERPELEKNLSLTMIGGSPVLKQGVPPFSVDLGKHHRLVYIHSAPLSLPEREDFMKVALGKNLRTAQGGATLAEPIEQKVRIPDLYSFFHINGVNGQIVKNNDGDPEQFLIVETSVEAKSEDVAKVTEAYLLPVRKKVEEGQEVDDPWGSPREVKADTLQNASPVALTLVPSKQETSKLHTFKIKVEKEGQLYVKIHKGLTSLGDFLLGSDYDSLLNVPLPQAQLEIQGKGGLLALNGERKLSIKSRGVPLIDYEIARVPADQINHLVSQTQGDFQNPEFYSIRQNDEDYGFDETDIARYAGERQPITMESLFKANYSTFDFSKHLQSPAQDGTPMQGLFFLKVRAWDPKKNEAIENVRDNRFILVTDLGILLKENTDGSREVFLQSIKNRAPIGGVSIDILARNGVPAISGTTNAEGRVSFPSIGKPEREKEPVAIVARLGNDVAFLPLERRATRHEDRKLDYSRFDVGGIENVSGKELEAFVFTERGVYRPGDELHVGFVVKQRDWSGNLTGLPIETEVRDASGSVVQVKKMALPEGGLAEFSYQTAYESPSGDYQLSVYLVRDGKRGKLLGDTSALVKEFLPDRMKIDSGLLQEGKAIGNSVGWVDAKAISASVSLRNLYGTPATGRRIVGRLVLTPSRFAFEAYKDYSFFDRLRENKPDVEAATAELGEKNTGDDGKAAFDLNLERFAAATYEATFYGEGFEAEGGRSVNTQSRVLVSALPYVVGFKPDADLAYLEMGSEHAVHFIAIDRALKPTAVDNVELSLTEQTYVSVLAKQNDGTYRYESVLKEKVIHTEPVTISAPGLSYQLPTATPGKYILELRDKETRVRLSRLSFQVVGRGAVARSLEKNAELDVKLSAKQYNAGDDIAVSITAPYTGSGLITIEREKVYAAQWFTADTTSSVQHIRLPDGFDGTGYVNVSFIRGLDSKEVFMSPLSYSAVPFTANLERRRLKIDLDVPKLTKPGEPLHLKYKTDRPAKIVVWAVDEGILQVTGYEVPKPLNYFFRKSALMVQTSQIVDLLLPEYSILHAAAFGGDGDERRLNPFKRVTEKPVVYWSGVIDADPTEREVVYDVPDYFNGTLKVMAMAYAPEPAHKSLLKPFLASATPDISTIAATHSVEEETIVRGPFVITPGVPTLAAPGDQFEVGVTVANNVVGSGPDAKVTLTATPSEHLEVVKAPAEPLVIPEGREVSVVLSVKVKKVLGSASLTFTVASGNESAKLRSTLSVRPSVPLMTDVRSGNFTKPQCDVPLSRAMYPQYRHLDAVVSALPLGLAHGLDAYLKNYPNGCSEQITSGAFCRLMVSGEADFALSRAEVYQQMQKTFGVLRRRQNDQGAFGYWSAGSRDGIDFLSVYVMHFLSEAKEGGFEPPQDVFEAGSRNLQKMVTLQPQNLEQARTIAYAIYLLTRQEIITTNYILNLRDYLDKQYPKTWQNDLTGVYLAGALALLKDNHAGDLIAAYKMGAPEPRNARWWGDFYQPLGADSQYVAIVARHFPERLKKITAAEFQSILKPVSEGRFNTLTAAYAVAALKSYSQHLEAGNVTLGISETIPSGDKTATHELQAVGKLLKQAPFSEKATALQFSARPQPAGIGAFYQVIETGFDLRLPEKPVKDGMEVYRELVDKNGKPVNATDNPAKLGEPVTVRLRIRTLNGASVNNVSIIDLLPGGFEIVSASLPPGPGSNGCDFVEPREDRAILFTSIQPSVRTITYQIKPCNRGEFVVPPVFAESMYDRTLKARGLGGKIRVIEAK